MKIKNKDENSRLNYSAQLSPLGYLPFQSISSEH